MRSIIIAVSLCVSMLGPCLAQTPAAAMTRIETQILPQPLGDALQQFAKLRHMQVLYLMREVKDLRTPGASGSLTIDETLSRLLSGTGLEYRYVDTNAVSIIRSSPSHPNGASRPSSVSDSPSRRSAKALGPTSPSTNAKATETPDPPVTHQSARSSQSTGALREVVVTAQLYRQSAYQVPINLDVLTDHELDSRRIFSLASLQYDVPGLYVQTGGGFSRITIDGVGNGIGNGALVGEYLDDADITGDGDTGGLGVGTGDVGLYDVSRVEVLHGPQGTLYGDGSMGGVIRVITNKPTLDRVQFSSQVAAVFSQYGAPGQQIQTMINLPLAENSLGFRVSGSFEHDGGWIDEPQANSKNVNSANLTNVRFEALWRPTAGLNVDAMQIIGRDNYGVGYGEDAQGNIAAPLPFGLTTTPQGTQTFNLSNLSVSWSVNDLRLLSSSTYFTHTFSWGNVFVTPDVSTAFDEYILYRNQTYTDKDYSEELRLSKSSGGAWEWMVGGFYKHYTDTDGQNASLTFSTPAAPVINVSFTGLDTGVKSTAAFMNASYRVSPRLELGSGVRYYRAEETYNEPVYNYHGYLGLGLIPGKFEEGTFTSTDPRFYARYVLTPNVAAYATASKGFREGGFNGPGVPNYEPETLWRYDAGLKSRLVRDTLQINLDGFYSDYSNYVTEGVFPGINIPYDGNAGTAHIKGIDADVRCRVGRSWLVGVAAEYTDARFASITALHTPYTVGEQVPLVTKYSFSTSIERDFQWYEKEGHAVIDYSEISAVQASSSGYLYPIAKSEVMRLLNFNSSMKLGTDLSVGVFARNLLNDRGYLDPFWIYGEGSRQPPRTFGVDFQVHLSGE